MHVSRHGHHVVFLLWAGAVVLPSPVLGDGGQSDANGAALLSRLLSARQLANGGVACRSITHRRHYWYLHHVACEAGTKSSW